MHSEFKIQEMFPESFANKINKPVKCIHSYITYHKNVVFFFLDSASIGPQEDWLLTYCFILFWPFLNDVNKFRDITSCTFVARGVIAF